MGREMWVQKTRGQDLEKEKESLSKLVLERKRQCEELENEMAKLRLELDEVKDSNSKSALETISLKEQLAKLEGELCAKQGLEALIDECQQLQTQLRESKERADRNETELRAEIAMQSSSHQHEVEEIGRSHSAQIAQHNASLLAVNKQLNESQSELKQLREGASKREESYQHEIEVLQSKLKVAGAQETESSNAITRLQRTLEEIQKELFRCKEERNSAEAETLAAEERAKDLERRLAVAEGGETPLAALERQHANALAKLQQELETEKKKVESTMQEYLECKKERNKAEHDALEAEEQLRQLEEKFKLSH